MLTGVVGHIKWHRYTAAAINGYTVTWSKDQTQWTLTATVVLSDAFKIAQRPLTFVAQYKNAQGETCAWRWPIREMQLQEHALSATLGPPEA